MVIEVEPEDILSPCAEIRSALESLGFAAPEMQRLHALRIIEAVNELEGLVPREEDGRAAAPE